jgi:TPR repeat protein
MAEGLKWLRRAAEQGLEEAQSVIMMATAGN